jgi:long-chain fatty acid transport protein
VRLAARWLLAVAVLTPSVSSASPEDLFGVGPRSAAMGGSGAASSGDWEASYANPALLSRARSNLLAVGLQGAVFDLHADGGSFPARVSTLAAKGVVVGAAVPLPLGGDLRDRVSLGMALYTPSDTLVRAHIPYPETPSFPLLADRVQSLTMRFGAGADIGHGLRVGAGFAVLAELLGAIAVNGAGGMVTSSVDDQLVATYAPTFGASWEFPLERAPDGAPAWRVGAVWRGVLQARFDVTVDASMLSSLSLPPLHIGGVAQYDPEELSVEVARERDSWVLAAGLTWKRWSSYPGPFEPTVVCTGSAGCSALSPPAVRLADTVVPRVAVERTFDLARRAAARLRGGFFLEPTPVPSSLASSQAYDAASQALGDVPTRFFDAARAVFSAGAGVDLGDRAPVAVDLSAQYHWLLPRTVDTPPSPPARLSGGVLGWSLSVAARF